MESSETLYWLIVVKDNCQMNWWRHMKNVPECISSAHSARRRGGGVRGTGSYMVGGVKHRYKLTFILTKLILNYLFVWFYFCLIGGELSSLLFFVPVKLLNYRDLLPVSDAKRLIGGAHRMSPSTCKTVQGTESGTYVSQDAVCLQTGHVTVVSSDWCFLLKLGGGGGGGCCDVITSFPAVILYSNKTRWHHHCICDITLYLS